MYTDFVRIGSHRINLAQVTEVLEFSQSDTVRVYWNYTVDGEYRAAMPAYDDFKGDEGKLLLAYVDGDDEEIARLDSLLNAPKLEPETVQQCPKCNGRMIWTDADHVAVRCVACGKMMH